MLNISLGFDQASLQMLVQNITSKMDLLLEVVNYNVEQQQYVCAGHVSTLVHLHRRSCLLMAFPDPGTLGPGSGM